MYGMRASQYLLIEVGFPINPNVWGVYTMYTSQYLLIEVGFPILAGNHPAGGAGGRNTF